MSVYVYYYKNYKIKTANMEYSIFKLILLWYKLLYNIFRLLINAEFLSNMLVITSNKWKPPKFKSEINFSIYKKVRK